MSDDGKDSEENGSNVIDGVIQAYHFVLLIHSGRLLTMRDNERDFTIAIACGQDWRAIESGAHSYASFGREYSSMTHWEKDSDGNLVGSIEIPMAVGLVGGAVRIHPGAQANVALLGLRTANDLAKVMKFDWLLEPFGALRALATVGIQAGHEITSDEYGNVLGGRS